MLIEWHALSTSRPMPSVMAQREIEPVREHDQTRGDLLAVRERERLAVGAGRDRGHLARNESAAGRNLGAHRVHQRVVEEVVLGVGTPLDQAAEARDRRSLRPQ